MKYARYYVEVKALSAPTRVPFMAGGPWDAVAVRGFDLSTGRPFPAVALRTQRGGGELDVSTNGVYEVLFSDAPLSPRSLDQLLPYAPGQGIADPAIQFFPPPWTAINDVKVGNEDPTPPPPPAASWIFTNSASLT